MKIRAKWAVIALLENLVKYIRWFDLTSVRTFSRSVFVMYDF